MMTQQRCAICDCDREGNVWPESADALCADHWLLASVRSLVQCGAWSEFDMDKWGKRFNHRALLCHTPPENAPRRCWQASVLSVCNHYVFTHGVRVTWDDGTGDPADSEGDRYTLMTGLIASWVWQAVERAMMERTSGGRAA